MDMLTDSKLIGTSLALILILLVSATGLCQDKPAEPANNDGVAAITVSLPKEDMPAKAIIVGAWTEKLTDPKCVDYEALIKATGEWREVKKGKIETGTGKYWILMSQASDSIRKLLLEYAEERKISFVCSQKALYSALRKLPEFKDKKDSELAAKFDITKDVADYGLKQKAGKDKKK